MDGGEVEYPIGPKILKLRSDRFSDIALIKLNHRRQRGGRWLNVREDDSREFATAHQAPGPIRADVTSPTKNDGAIHKFARAGHKGHSPDECRGVKTSPALSFTGF